MTYTIQIKHIKKGWQDGSVIKLFNLAIKEEIEAEIKEEMRSYGNIAIRCRVENDQGISYLFTN